jgi:hypothetical protein
MDLRAGIELHVPEDPGQAPAVLVFEPAGIAPPHHLDGESILAGADVSGQVEFGGCATALAVSHLLAI